MAGTPEFDQIIWTYRDKLKDDLESIFGEDYKAKEEEIDAQTETEISKMLGHINDGLREHRDEILSQISNEFPGYSNPQVQEFERKLDNRQVELLEALSQEYRSAVESEE